MEITISFIIIIVNIILAALIAAYLKNRIISLFEHKYGNKNPKNTNILKPVANALKLLIKEDLAPKSRKKILYFLAPLIVFCPIVTAFALIPLNSGTPLLNIDASAILFLALVSIPVAGVFFAGYSSSNKGAFISSIRSIILTSSFQIPIGISILGVSFLSNSLAINDIIMTQNTTAGLFGWHFIPQILSCIIFFICTLMILNCGPFNITEGENQLTSSYTAEYSGSKLAVFHLAKYALLFAISLFFICLFFGGYLSPFGTYVLPDFLVSFEQIFWLILKTFLVILSIFLIEITLPKLSYERVLNFSFKILMPLSLINLNITIFIGYFLGSN